MLDYWWGGPSEQERLLAKKLLAGEEY